MGTPLFAATPHQLFTDLFEGKINNKMFNVLAWCYRRADWATGTVRRASAAQIQAEMWPDELEGRGRPSLREIQRVLKYLRLCGYIKSNHKQGSRRTYLITICNYVTLSDGEPKLINLTETLDYHHLNSPSNGEIDSEPYSDTDGGSSSESSRSDTVSRPRTLPYSTVYKDCNNSTDSTACIVRSDVPDSEPSGSGSFDTSARTISVLTSIAGTQTENELLNPASGDASPDAMTLQQIWCELRVHTWNESVTAGDVQPECFDALIKKYGIDEVKNVLRWLGKSDYWGKPGAGYLDGARGLSYAYPTMRKHYLRYKERAIETLNRKRKKKAAKQFDGDSWQGDEPANSFDTDLEDDDD